MADQTLTQVTEEELRRVFADTLDVFKDKVPFSGILVAYCEGGQVRIETGVPYSLSDGALEVRSYVNDIVTSRPEYYPGSMKQIPISAIVTYQRVENLSDIL